MKTAGGGGFPRLARVMTCLMLMLTGLGTGVKAADVLYATVDGTAMTLKYGSLPASGATTYDPSNPLWHNSFCANITTATVDESCKNYAGETLTYLFYAMENLTAISGLENLNTASVTDMQEMFNSCSKLASLDLSKFNTAEVTVMLNMFAGCTALTTLDLSTWNTAKVTDMSAMFGDCSSLTTIKVGDGWNTDAVTSSSYMFYNCNSLPNFSSSTIDKTNAHTGTGGYLTAAAPAAAEGFTAALAEGTEDAGNWKLAVGDGTAQALPVEGLSEGQTLTLTYTGNRRVRSVKAIVVPAEAAVKVTAITLNKTATTITKISGTATETLSVTAVTPDEATDKTYTWSSANTDVATVDAEGKVTAVAEGTAHIRATANDGSEVYGECTVTVLDLSAYYSKMTSCGSSGMDQVTKLIDLGRGYTSYNSSLTAAQAWELAKYRATVDGKTTYVIMSSQDDGYEIHYALSTDAAATEHVSDLDDLVDPYLSTILNMYYIAQ